MAGVLANYARYEIIEPDGEHVWNNFRTIEGSASPKYMISDITLIYKNYRYERMIKIEEDNDI